MKPKITEKIGPRLTKVLGYATWLLIIIFSVSVVRNIGKVMRIRSDVAAERERLAKMQSENDDIQAEIAKSSGGDFIEKQIRDKLGLAKGGEAIVVLPDAETLRKLAPQAPTEEDTLPDPNWKKWIKLFI